MAMKKKKKPTFTLLHRHGNAGPGNRASFISFGKFKDKTKARKEAKDLALETHRIVPSSAVLKTKVRGLVAIKR